MQGFIADIYAPLRHQAFNISKAQGKSEIEPYGMFDNIGMKSVSFIGYALHN